MVGGLRWCPMICDGLNFTNEIIAVRWEEIGGWNFVFLFGAIGGWNLVQELAKRRRDYACLRLYCTELNEIMGERSKCKDPSLDLADFRAKLDL